MTIARVMEGGVVLLLVFHNFFLLPANAISSLHRFRFSVDAEDSSKTFLPLYGVTPQRMLSSELQL
jgi:hypothetical protein